MARHASPRYPGAVLALVIALLLACAAPASAQPNVVLVLTDDLSTDLIDYMPNVQAMQRDGMSFSRYMVTNSLCCPSRVSILTGRYPHSTGVMNNQPPHGGFAVFHPIEERSTYATSLSTMGYRTAMMGKYLNGYTPWGLVDGVTRFVPPGWSTWAVAGNNYGGFNYDLAVKGHGSPAFAVRYGSRPEDYLPDVMSRRGQRFIRESVAAGAPFLLQLSTFTPHSPFTPAPRDSHLFQGLRAPRGPLFDRPQLLDAPFWLSGAPLNWQEVAVIDRHYRKRVQSVQAIDKLVGDIRAELRRSGVDHDTYVIFTSDNGFHMGERRLLEGKQTYWDHDVRVPLIVIGPGVPPGTTASDLAANVDLRPTFEELAGVPVAPHVEGRSLVPFLRGQMVDGWRAATLVEHRGPGNVSADPDLQGIRQGKPPSYWALRFRDALYVEYKNPVHPPEYYVDPLERRNIYATLPEARQLELAAQLDRMRTCAGGAECRAADQAQPWLGLTPLRP